MKKIREYGLRATQFVLGIDGVLHLTEVASAIYEEAWLTATLTSIHAVFFFVGVYLIGHDHTHHRGDHDESE
tara:strand:- start:5121 stop:5336 length:216 start_codon:yes stop_codon:yes gene_type:complete